MTLPRSLSVLALLIACGPPLQTVKQLAEDKRLQEDAPVRAGASKDIRAPIEIVWSVFSAIDGWPRWNKDAVEAKLKGPFAAGSVFEYGRTSRHHLTLARVETPHLVSFYGTYSGYKG